MKLEPAEIFKVLGVDTRIKILDLLKSQGMLGAKAISESLGITPAAVSQHLKILKQAGLVSSERQGYWIPYSINEDVLEQCRGVLTKVCTCGCRGTSKNRAQASNEVALESLKQEEERLQKELACVQARIRAIETES